MSEDEVPPFPSLPVFMRSAVADPPEDDAPFGDCYQTASGMTVHVRPGCRCKT